MRIRNFLIFAGAFFLLVWGNVYAHGELFFEFNPKSAKSVVVSEGEVPSQIIIPQNDVVSGLDVWLDNPGSNGDASFELYDKGNTLLAKKIVQVPAISSTPGGKLLHIDFDSNISIHHDEKYTIRVVTELPSLRLYYGNRIKLLSHNARYVSPYLEGVAQLGSIEQSYTFKFALYENQETILPVIIGVSSTPISDGEVLLSFHASEPVDARVEYGISGEAYTQLVDFSNAYTPCSTENIPCSLTLPVSPDTAYSYRLTVRDIWGNTASEEGIFESAAVGFVKSQTQDTTDNPPPVQSEAGPSIVNAQIVSVTEKAITVAWQTDKAATSELVISSDESGFQIITAATDFTYELEHFIGTANVLSSNKSYFATILSEDIKGNESSTVLPFKTASTTASAPSIPASQEEENSILQTQPGAQNELQNQQEFAPQTGETKSLPKLTLQVTDERGKEITISWNDLLKRGEKIENVKGYRVDIFNEEFELVRQEYVSSLEDSVTVKGLPAGTYQAVVYADRGNGIFERIADAATFTIETPEVFGTTQLNFWLVYGSVSGLIVLVAWIILKIQERILLQKILRK